MKRLHRPSPAMTVALIALFVALGGTGYAAFKLPKNSVGSKQIKADAVTSSKVKNQSLLAGDFKAGQLPAGAQGLPGPKGDNGTNGTNGRSALDSLRGGETIRGAWGVRGDSTNGGIQVTGITFPVPAPVPVDSAHVVLAGNDTVPGDGCTGTAVAPVAGPGFVCVYAAVAKQTDLGSGNSALSPDTDGTGTGDGSSYGFDVSVTGKAGFVIGGTWAYTAP